MAAEAAADSPDLDEKKPQGSDVRSGTSISEEPISEQTQLHRWLNKLDRIPGLETRGIERVPEDYRHRKVTTASYVQMFLIWFSINASANNITLGILGPVAYGLGFHDAIM